MNFSIFRLLEKKVHYRVSNYRHFFSLSFAISPQCHRRKHTQIEDWLWMRISSLSTPCIVETWHRWTGETCWVITYDIYMLHSNRLKSLFGESEWVKTCEIFNFQLQLLRRAKLFNISHLTSQSSARDDEQIPFQWVFNKTQLYSIWLHLTESNIHSAQSARKKRSI